MIYAWVHDGMEQVEKRLEITPPVTDVAGAPVDERERDQLLGLAAQLATRDSNIEARLDVGDQMYRVLNHNGPPEKKRPTQKESRRRPPAPLQPSPAFPWDRDSLAPTPHRAKISTVILALCSALDCH